MPTITTTILAPAVKRGNLLALDPTEIERLVLGFGWPKFRAVQILRWLYRRRARSVEAMTDLSKAGRERLSASACIERADRCRVLESSDGTKKFLIGLTDGLEVESVLIPDDGRVTLCLSTQVGCTLDCAFCLTGRMGLLRNLKPHEIVEQALTVQDHLPPHERLSNIVLMGMGEPLANWEAVKDALARFTEPDWGLGISPRRITLSTAGLASRLRDAADLGVNLAVSLNATTEEQRNRIMPAANRLHSLQSLLAACRAVPLAARRRLTFEYVLLAGENNTDADAARLVRLLQGLRCKVNLIPFNEFPGSPYRRPDDRSILAFQAKLKRAGLPVFIRKSKGRDVLGACGQLGRQGGAGSDFTTRIALLSQRG